MTEDQAKTVASVFDGLPWQPTPGMWLVIVTRPDGSLVAVDNRWIAEYPDEQAFETRDALCEIDFDN